MWYLMIREQGFEIPVQGQVKCFMITVQNFHKNSEPIYKESWEKQFVSFFNMDFGFQNLRNLVATFQEILFNIRIYID